MTKLPAYCLAYLPREEHLTTQNASWYLTCNFFSFAAGQELASFLVTEIMQLPSLTSLNVSFNYFRGSLPMDYSRLENLDLQFNQIASLIPLGFFANAPSLRLLNIGSNIFLGTIPSDVGKASNMQYLYIFKNLLGGQLPLSIYNLPLVEFQAQGNFLEGSLPLDSQSIFNNGWEMTLETLWLSDNRLVGSLPRALASFPNLRDLDVSGNDLVGAVPSELALLPSLESLKLGLNKFSGAIPDSLCTISSLRPLELEADCLPLDGPSNQCLCCTTCCDRTTVMCQPAPADISAIDGLLTP
jgi:Leucine-rich repeat (LRR) protein